MGTRFHIGAKDLRGGLAAYAKRFDFLEVTVLPAGARGATEAPVKAKDASTTVKSEPTLPTLRRWRKEVPPHFDFCVVAGPNLSKLKPGEAFERELTVARAAIDALQARCFLLRTPPEVTPGPVWRERMGKLLERLPRDATHIVWEPSGVWETDEAALTAKRWNVVLVVDAARDHVPPGGVAYTRLRALGETRSFGPAAIERIVDAIGARRDAYVVLETASALAECKRLRQASQSVTTGKDGGLSRMIRPRGGILVRDDEQE